MRIDGRVGNRTHNRQSHFVFDNQQLFDFNLIFHKYTPIYYLSVLFIC